MFILKCPPGAYSSLCVRYFYLNSNLNVSVPQIHKYTEGVSLSPERNHLSEIEVLMLRHPELLKKVCKQDL